MCIRAWIIHKYVHFCAVLTGFWRWCNHLCLGVQAPHAECAPPHSWLADVSAVPLPFRPSRILWMMHQATFTSGHSVSRVSQMKHTNWISFTNLLEPLLQGSPSPASPAPITVDDVSFFICRQSWFFFFLLKLNTGEGWSFGECLLFCTEHIAVSPESRSSDPACS